MDAFISRIIPQHPSAVALQWVLENVTESGSFSFEIYRSGSPGGPWTLLDTVVDVYLYADTLGDEDANTLAISRDIYYRVGAIPPSGVGNRVFSPIVNLDGLTEYSVSGPSEGIGYVLDSPGQYEPQPATGQMQRPTVAGRKRLLKRALQRKIYIGLKKLYGVEFWLLKRRHFGTRCPNCYSKTARLVISGCPVCYGTSWDGGYYTPIDLLGKRETAPIQTVTTPQQKAEILRTQIVTLDFPRIDSDDLLVEKHANRRWIVTQRAEKTLKGVIVAQILDVSELSHKDDAYTVPVTLA